MNISKSGFFEGKAYVPSQWLAADGNYLLDHSDEIRALYGFQAGGSDYQPGSIFDINEKTTTAYVQANYEFNVFDKPLDGQIGVRFVKVDTNMNFFENANGDGVDWQPIEDEASENRALKNFVIRYSLTDQLMTRFTYGETIRRPGYGDLNPARTYRPTTTGLEFGTASGGNPNLKPQFTSNYEANISVDDKPLFAFGVNETTDIFTNVVYQSATNRQVSYRTYDNLGKSRETYFRVIGVIPPGKKFFAVLGTQYNRNNYNGFYEGKPILFNRGTWSVFTFQSFKLDGLSTMTLIGFWRFKGKQQFY